MPSLDPCQTLRELLATMHALRAPGGCPWDAEQTPETLVPYLLEEACEAIEAIETGTSGMIADELGDLLLQIIFQAEIFAERGEFDFADITSGINAKLVRRHPHVFGGKSGAATTDDLARQWESIKLMEQTVPSPRLPGTLGQLPGYLPALQRAQKLIGRARRTEVNIDRWLTAPAIGEEPDEEGLGKALLALVERAELNGLDAEQTLRRMVQKILDEINENPTNSSDEK